MSGCACVRACVHAYMPVFVRACLCAKALALVDICSSSCLSDTFPLLGAVPCVIILGLERLASTAEIRYSFWLSQCRVPQAAVPAGDFSLGDPSRTCAGDSSSSVSIRSYPWARSQQGCSAELGHRQPTSQGILGLLSLILGVSGWISFSLVLRWLTFFSVLLS